MGIGGGCVCVCSKPGIAAFWCECSSVSHLGVIRSVCSRAVCGYVLCVRYYCTRRKRYPAIHPYRLVGIIGSVCGRCGAPGWAHLADHTALSPWPYTLLRTHDSEPTIVFRLSLGDNCRNSETYSYTTPTDRDRSLPRIMSPARETYLSSIAIKPIS